MLHQFLTTNRDEVIRRCRDKVGKRFEPSLIPSVVDHGVPLFLDQLVETLRGEQSTIERPVSEPEPTPASSEIGLAAALHGSELLRLGYSIDQVVHDYGDVCQAVTELAVEQKEIIAVDEFRTLNRCLDYAIADAVTAYGRSRDAAVQARDSRSHSLALERRRLIDMAMKAFFAIKTGKIGVDGATGSMLCSVLLELRDLGD